MPPCGTGERMNKQKVLQRLCQPGLAVTLACVISLLSVLAWLVLLAPIRETYLPDQQAYDQLARNVADRGRFARGSGGEVPEPWRTIGYPLFIAALYKITGTIYPAAIAVQGTLVVLLPALAYLLASHVTSRRLAIASSIAVALYVPLSFYSVFVVSDVLPAVLITAGMTAVMRALLNSSPRWAVVAGILFGFAGLIRPVFAPVGLGLALGLLLFRTSLALRNWKALCAMAILSIAIGIVPSAGYTYMNFGRPGLVAAGTGLQLWLGYWEGVWPGETMRAILVSTGELPAGVAPQDAPRALRYREQFLHLFSGRETLSPEADVQRWRENDTVALGWAGTEISNDSWGYLSRGLTYRQPVLWAAELAAIRPENIPRLARLAVYAPQLFIAALAVVGLFVMCRSSTAGQLITMMLAYVAVAHFPFWVDARYSLPVKPLLLIAAVVGASALLGWIAAMHRRTTRRPPTVSGGRSTMTA